MSNQYIVLKNINILDANCIGGLTYGFPSVTAFMGFVHGLSRQLKPKNGIELGGVGILCHKHQLKAYRNSMYDPYSFAQSRNPLNEKGLTAPINEEGKMNLTVSLVIQAKGVNTSNQQELDAQCQEIKNLAEIQKIAGGTVISIDDCYVTKNDCHQQIVRSLMPATALIDRSSLLLEKTNEGKSAIEGLLEFSSLIFKSTTIPLDMDSTEKVVWQHVNKNNGHLVPVNVGYKLVADTFEKGTVENVRDNEVPVSFVEPIHSLAEWVISPSKLNSIDDLLWHYHYESPFYVCRSLNQVDSNIEEDFDF